MVVPGGGVGGGGTGGGGVYVVLADELNTPTGAGWAELGWIWTGGLVGAAETIVAGGLLLLRTGGLLCCFGFGCCLWDGRPL